MSRLQLAWPTGAGGLRVEEAISRRRSKRDFSGEPMSMAELSHVLYFSGGITEERHGLRAAPSAGATYPMELYPAVSGIEGLPHGVYHYLVRPHELETVREGDFRQEISRAALGEKMIMRANLVLILSAVSQRTRKVYRDRAERYIHIEAGHIAQNTYLVATSIGLGACAIGAFYDNSLNRLIGVDGKRESVLYLVAVGKTAPS
jgi:SagB-type dehydrogenase family enzyme